MKVPEFSTAQDSNFVTLRIRLPYVKVPTIELDVNGDIFECAARPFFLKLKLPGTVLEDGREHCSYDAATQFLTVVLPKEIPGAPFDGLDMLTTLLPTWKPPEAPRGPLIEEISEDQGCEAEETELKPLELNHGRPSDAGVSSALMDMEDSTPTVVMTGGLECAYGFDDSKSGYFTAHCAQDVSEVIDLQEPDRTTAQQRTIARLAEEESKFDGDHYLGDTFMEDSVVPTLIAWMPAPDPDQLTHEQQQQLQQLPHRKYLAAASPQAEAARWLCMADILFGEAYDTRSTMGDSNCESWWSMWKISSTLCWLDSFSDVAATKRAGVRRALVFPLYRHFDLAMTVWGDVSRTLRSGRASVVARLLRVKDQLDHTEMKYILSKLYMDDYCVWAQQQPEGRFTELADALDQVEVHKEQLGFDLLVIEEHAREMLANGAEFELQEQFEHFEQ